jgi:WD40 repeat protein
MGRYLALGQERALGFALCHVALVDPAGKAKPRLLSFPPAAFLKSVLDGRQEGVVSLAFSPDGRWLVAGTVYGALQCWDLAQEPPRRVSRSAHKESLEALAFRPDGQALYTGAKDGVVKRWSFPALEQTARVSLGERVRSLAVHPTEGWLCCATDSETSFLSGDRLHRLRTGLNEKYHHICFLPDGCLLRAHDTLLISQMYLLGGVAPRWLLPPGRDRSHSREISSLSFSPDGALILSASRGREVRLWERTSGRLLVDLPADGRNPTAAFHPDGRSLAVLAGKEVRFYELGGLREQTFRAIGFLTLTDCALHPDGRSLACTGPRPRRLPLPAGCGWRPAPGSRPASCPRDG